MSVYDNLISILFKLPDGRSLNEYYKNILLATVDINEKLMIFYKKEEAIKNVLE